MATTWQLFSYQMSSISHQRLSHLTSDCKVQVMAHNYRNWVML